jgi:hypothetical protein
VIYVSPGVDEPLTQGDIFAGLPRIDLSLGDLDVVDENEDVVSANWSQIAKEGRPVAAVVGMRPVCAIVITQNCDAQHSRDITLCEIRPFQDIEATCREITATKRWVKIITQQARLNYKWFYLPPDDVLGFIGRMGVDFFSTVRVPRVDLEGFRVCRKRRLNDVAVAHFRERIAEFFRRYPYDEWYPLNTEELQAYCDEHPGTQPFPWQVVNTQGSQQRG